MQDKKFKPKFKPQVNNDLDFNQTSVYDQTTIDAVHRRLIELGLIIKRILNKNGIQFILAYGGLLGAAKLGHFFPWDDDLDFFIFDDDYEKAVRILRKKLPKHIIVHDAENDPFYFHSWSRIKDTSTRVVPNQSVGNIDNYIYLYPNLSLDLYRLGKITSNDPRDYLKNEAEKFFKKKLLLKLITKSEYQSLLEGLSTKIELFKPLKKQYGEFYMHVVKMQYPIHVNNILPLQNIELCEKFFPAPRNISKFLNASYKNPDVLPKKMERLTNYRKVIL